MRQSTKPCARRWWHWAKGAIDPLIATLQASNDDLRVQVIDVLAQLQAKSAVPYLLSFVLAPTNKPGPGESAVVDQRVSAAARQMITNVLGAVPSRDAAEQFLTRRLDEYLAGTAPGLVDQNNQVTVWEWDESQKLLLQRTMPADDAAFLAAAQAAQQRYQIDPSCADYQQMYLATALEVAKRITGYDRPLTPQAGPIFHAASIVSPAVLEDVLRLALKRNMQGAAVAVIDLLGATANGELLKSSDGKPRLLAQRWSVRFVACSSRRHKRS